MTYRKLDNSEQRQQSPRAHFVRDVWSTAPEALQLFESDLTGNRSEVLRGETGQRVAIVVLAGMKVLALEDGFDCGSLPALMESGGIALRSTRSLNKKIRRTREGGGRLTASPTFASSLLLRFVVRLE